MAPTIPRSPPPNVCPGAPTVPAGMGLAQWFDVLNRGRIGMDSKEEPGTLPWQATRLPLLLVLSSLLTLVAVPIVIQNRASAVRSEINGIAEPALQEVDRIQLAIALETSATRGYLLTGDRRFLGLYQEALTAEELALARLLPLTRRLGPGFVEQVTTLQALRARATAPVDSLFAGLLPARDYVARIPVEQAILEEGALTASRLTRALTRAVADRVERIEDIERLGTGLTILLVVFALIAALFVERLGARFRSAAARFERRAREEAALRRAAQAVTGASTVDEVVHRIVESALDAVGGDGAVVKRIDQEREDVEVAAVAGDVEQSVGARTPYPGSLTEAVVARLEPLLVVGRTIERETSRQDGNGTTLVVPLVYAGEALGVLELHRGYEQPSFQMEDVARARTFADLAALAFYKVALLQQSEQRRQELERTVESRARLIRGFSHDVKNPLGAAEGYAQLLEEGITNGLTPRQKESVAKIRRSIRSALRLIDDLLDIARAEARQLRLEREPVDVRRIAAETVEEFRAAAEANGVALETRLSEAVPVIESDEGRIRQILGNLLSNAIRYTPENGRVVVRAGSGEDGSAPGVGRWVALAVEDTGPGIPREQQEAIFEEFRRAEGTTEGGAGIGLSISRILARALGGDITVESEVGKGSTFTVWLPVGEAQSEASRNAA